MRNVPDAQIDKIVFDFDGGIVVLDDPFVPLRFEYKTLNVSE